MFMTIRLKPLLIISAAVALAVILAIILPAPYVSSADEGKLCVPVIMYHSISRDESRLGEYVVSPQTFEEDVIFLKQQGFTAVTVNDLVRHLRYGEELPDKPVIITLDDGHLNVLTRALPIIKKHGFKMTVSCVGEWSFAAGEEASPDENYSYLDADDIKKLRATGLVEIACHSFDMHSLDSRQGVLRAEGESDDNYRSRLLGDIFKAQRFFREYCDFEPNVFTYPYGLCSKDTAAIVKSAGFDATLGCEEGVNIIESEVDLYGLKRFNRPYGESSADFFKRCGIS
ncbi:MAG: polysaccharide deacetylase family protein [Ruminococcus sp.]|nr:polysaccharide deacetylase family protein [Ruminococcus sp.]